MIIEVTGHSDCPMWDSEGSSFEVSLCGIMCPEYYKGKSGKEMRRPKSCPAKQGILVRLKRK